MKITVDIDCTPQEARSFLGLPEVEKMQEAVMKELQAKMLENIANLDPENMMKTWLPAGVQGLEQMQKMFWSQFNNGDNGSK
ncbi:DUF6489 family protein [Sneathiella sp. HT1-7]|jgi:hypothetical protein|uniref:DUF6489 family protein n=1 Tax=Sneathiella sp. HT1-7 TaxID=2887192 RepID=UPI001D138BAF|nr:DUF6489 family protein [Sneathiella sp. HT1-7]MCC3303971.1 DUF6489 family protein [Sneathiella sp. HT1-7]